MDIYGQCKQNPTEVGLAVLTEREYHEVVGGLAALNIRHSDKGKDCQNDPTGLFYKIPPPLCKCSDTVGTSVGHCLQFSRLV